MYMPSDNVSPSEFVEMTEESVNMQPVNTFIRHDDNFIDVMKRIGSRRINMGVNDTVLRKDGLSSLAENDFRPAPVSSVPLSAVKNTARADAPPSDVNAVLELRRRAADLLKESNQSGADDPNFLQNIIDFQQDVTTFKAGPPESTRKRKKKRKTPKPRKKRKDDSTEDESDDEDESAEEDDDNEFTTMKINADMASRATVAMMRARHKKATAEQKLAAARLVSELATGDDMQVVLDDEQHQEILQSLEEAIEEHRIASEECDRVMVTTNMPALFIRQKQLRQRLNIATPVATPPGCVTFTHDPTAATVNCHMKFRDEIEWNRIMSMLVRDQSEKLRKYTAINAYFKNPANRVVVSSGQNLMALPTPEAERNIFETIFALRDCIETINPAEDYLRLEYTGRLLCLRSAPRFKNMPKAVIMWRGMANAELEHYSATDMRIITDDLLYFLWVNIEKDENKYPPSRRSESGLLLKIINDASIDAVTRFQSQVRNPPKAPTIWF